MPLDLESTQLEFKKLTKEINNYLEKNGGKKMKEEEVALGFINIANGHLFIKIRGKKKLILKTMCRPIRTITVFIYIEYRYLKDMIQVTIHYLVLEEQGHNMQY
jgi:hypothetical protein